VALAKRDRVRRSKVDRVGQWPVALPQG